MLRKVKFFSLFLIAAFTLNAEVVFEDDFEKYEDFTTEIGNWTTYDEDKTNMLFDEFFEENVHQFTADLDDNENTSVEFTSTVVKEGNKSGRRIKPRLKL